MRWEGRGVDSSRLGKLKLASSCEHSNKNSGCVEWGEFLE
jgi:hypothetical protein